MLLRFLLLLRGKTDLPRRTRPTTFKWTVSLVKDYTYRIKLIPCRCDNTLHMLSPQLCEPLLPLWENKVILALRK